jgi:hypothetical protein
MDFKRAETADVDALLGKPLATQINADEYRYFVFTRGFFG